VKFSGQRRKYRHWQRQPEKLARWRRDLPFVPGEFGAMAAAGVWFGDQIASFDAIRFQYGTIARFPQNNTLRLGLGSEPRRASDAN